MKIKCITNKTKDIPLEILTHFTTSDSQVGLITGKEYVVYAISEFYLNPRYCIADEFYSSYPMWIPMNFFEIVDPRPSRYWIFSFKNDKPKIRFFLGFPEWANDEYFYNNIVMEKPRKTDLKAYKERMDLEFPDASIVNYPQVLDKEWLMCPICIDAWQSTDGKDALIKCPICQKIYNNPQFQK